MIIKNERFFHFLLFTVLIFTALSACKSKAQSYQDLSVEEAYTQLEELYEKTPMPKLNEPVDTTVLNPYIREVEKFSEAHSKYEKLPDHLIRAAGLANGTGWSNKSIQLWGYFWRNFPEHEKAGESLFFQGFVMDSKYKDYRNAIHYYDLFLSKYPKHALVDQVKLLKKQAKEALKSKNSPSPKKS